MKINHNPIFKGKTELIERHYSEKDGVPVKYVCTSAVSEHSNVAGDVFYRETPHTEFGNKYFILYYNYANELMIAGYDHIEDQEFGMMTDGEEWFYSRHRHDMFYVGSGFIDGGRSYFRRIPNGLEEKMLVLRDGNFVEKEESDAS